MTLPGEADRLLAVLAMVVSIAPIVRSAMHSTAGPGAPTGPDAVSWRRIAVLLAGGTVALAGVSGLLLLRVQVLSETVLYRPTWLGGTLAFVGGMLAVATLLAGRDGMTESAAIRHMTQAAAMVVFPAAPRLALGALGLTRLARASLPWTLARRRWMGLAEGIGLLALCALEHEVAVGGLRARLELGP